MDGHGLPVDLLCLVLQQLLGEERQDGYRLVRDLQSFALVCHTWRDATFSTPLHLNLDYMPELKWEAVRWLLKATFADLQIHPNFHVNRLLTNPDFASRNHWTLQRLWGAQMVGAPGRWPQWRHFPCLDTLELNCDTQAVALDQPQYFESRVLAPLTKLKHLTLQQFGGADLTRLPPSLLTLHADLDLVLPLTLSPGLQLEEFTLTTSRLLCDWAQLCKQVGKLILIEAAAIDMVVEPTPEGATPITLSRHAANGFKQGTVLEVELVAQEVGLVRLEGGVLPKYIPENAYQPEVVDSMHLASLAAEFQHLEFRSFGCIYNPDDLQAEEELGMSDGMTVHLHRHVPGRPQVVGFTYGLAEEQLSYLLSEAEVEGLALEAVEAVELGRVLNSEEFQRRSGASLHWLQGLDLLGELELGAFPQLQRVEGYVLNEAGSSEAVGRLPLGLTSLDLCGVPREGDDPLARDSWPDFINRAGQPGHPCLAHLTQLQELSLRHFREVDLSQHMPPSVEAVTLECPRPLAAIVALDVHVPEVGDVRCTCAGCTAAMTAAELAAGRWAERFNFLLPPLEAGAQRTLNIQLHQNEDYSLRRPILFLSQFLGHATHVTISVTSTPVAEPSPDNGEAAAAAAADDGIAVAGGGAPGPEPQVPAFPPAGGGAAAAGAAAPAVAPPPATLVLAAGHGTLREALDALSASPLQSIDVEAPEVLFTDDEGASYTSSRRMQDFIKQQYSNTWLIWAHDAMHPDEEEEEGGSTGGRHGGGFTMRRK